MHYPKISIITPSYRQSIFLEQAIKSVFDQNYNNLEYIIIDGGSDDGSVDIIKKYENIITYWVSEKDEGQADAIQKGLLRTTGDIFAWHNSDDRYLPGTFHYVSQVFFNNPQIDLLFGGWNFIDEEGKMMGTRHPGPFSLMKLRAGSIIPPQPAVFIRMNAVVKAGDLNLKKKHAMDYDLYVRIARTDNVLLVDRVLGDFRIHKKSKTVSDYPSQLKEIIETRKDHFGKTAKWNERLYWIWIDVLRYVKYSTHKIFNVFSFRDIYTKYLNTLKAIYQR